MASAQVQLPGIRWREAIVKIDNDTYLKVQYLFNKDVSDPRMLADLVASGYSFGRAWFTDARGVTKENADEQDWKPYADKSRAAVSSLETGGAGVISQRDDVGGSVSQEQKEFIAATADLARNPRDQGAIRRLAEASLKMRAMEERRERPAEGGTPAAGITVEEAPVEVRGEIPPRKAFAPDESEAAKESSDEAGKARSLELYTPDDPQRISYGFQIHWKEGYVPSGTYDPSDIWSTERFVFSNLDGIDRYEVTGFVGGRFDSDRGIGQFSGESFAVEYMRRAFLRLETDVGGETVRLYVPRGLDLEGKTFADLINSPDMVAISVVEGGKERFLWDIYAQRQEDLLAALQKRFPDMGFAEA